MKTYNQGPMTYDQRPGYKDSINSRVITKVNMKLESQGVGQWSRDVWMYNDDSFLSTGIRQEEWGAIAYKCYGEYNVPDRVCIAEKQKLLGMNGEVLKVSDRL